MTEKEFEKEISIVWSVDDVKEVRDDLTFCECSVVLQSVKHDHDANIGVNWDVLRDTAEMLFPERDDDNVNN